MKERTLKLTIVWESHVKCDAFATENNFDCDIRKQAQLSSVKSHNSLAASAVRAHMYTFTQKHKGAHTLPHIQTHTL